MTNRGRAAELKARRRGLDTKLGLGHITEAEHRLECLILDAEYHGEHWDQGRWHEHTDAILSAMARAQAEGPSSARDLIETGPGGSQLQNNS